MPSFPIDFQLNDRTLAEAIHPQPLISKFCKCSTSHIINLFADNVILLLTNPCSPSYFNPFQYNLILQNKVKVKSLILDLGVHMSIRLHLMNKLPYSWADYCIPYLGIIITPPMSALSEANYKPLIEEISR